MSGKLFYNAAITTPLAGDAPASGADQGRVASWEKGALFVEDGLIAAVGDETEVRAALAAKVRR